MIEPIIGILVVAFTVWWLFFRSNISPIVITSTQTPSHLATVDIEQTPTIQVSLTIEATFTHTSTTSGIMTPSPVSIQGCGHELDIPFGDDPRFVIHRISSGDSLDLLAFRFETSIEAIQSINAFLPSPLWLEWLIVIPVKTTYVASLPAFTIMELHEENTTLEELAVKLDTPPNPLIRFNALSPDCASFTGWFIVPIVMINHTAAP